MNSPEADLRAVVWAGLRGLFVFVLAAAGATLGAQQEPTASSAVTVNVLAAPTATLTAEPSTIDAGDEVTLTWTTTEAVSASIDQGVGVLIPVEGGSVTVTPDTDTEYTLTATNRIGGSVTAAATVTTGGGPPVPPNLPVIDSFTPSSSTIEAGVQTTLSWETTNATAVTLDGASVALDDSQMVSPISSTTYELEATNSAGSTTASVRITVRPCAIDSFRASPSTIAEGGSSTLTWNTTSVSSVSISGISGTFDGDDSERVSPSTTTTYTLTATCTDGSPSPTDTETVNVTVTSCPVIDSFEADDGDATDLVITDGESTTLSWETTNATSVTLNGTAVNLDNTTGTNFSPNSTTTYTLRAEKASCPTATESLRIRVVDPPVIDSFEADDGDATDLVITRGESTTLEWRTTDATRVTLDGTAVNLDNTTGTNFSPNSTTTYTLQAVNDDGEQVTESLRIRVVPAPVIDSFEADETTITDGESTTLSWTTSNATSVTLDGTAVNLDNTTGTNFSPTSDTTYTLRAINDDGEQDTDTETVNVVDPPVINFFRANSTSITEGESTTLSWTTSNATSVTLDGTAVNLDNTSGTSFSPTSDTTYTLRAENNADTPATTTATVSITVTPPPAPTASLSAYPEELFVAGDPVELTWTTTHATSAEIDNGVGSVRPVSGGTVTDYPITNTLYTLTASGPGGTATASVDVLISDLQRVLTATLTADQLSITQGGSTTLSWTTEGAASAALSQDVGDDIGALPETEVAAGSRNVSPTETTTYTLTATAEGGATASASVTVTVTSSDPTIDSFSVDNATPNTGETVTLSWTTSNAASAVLQQLIDGTWTQPGTSVAPDGSQTVTRDSAGSESFRLLITRDTVAVLSATITITWSDPPAD